EVEPDVEVERWRERDTAIDLHLVVGSVLVAVAVVDDDFIQAQGEVGLGGGSDDRAGGVCVGGVRVSGCRVGGKRVVGKRVVHAKRDTGYQGRSFSQVSRREGAREMRFPLIDGV